MHGWQSEPTDGSKGGWGMLRLWVSYSLSLSPARLFPIVSIGSICLFLSACLFVHPFLWWSMAFSVYLGLSLSLFSILFLSIHPSIIDVSCCPSICPFIYLSLILRFHLSIQLSAIHFFSIYTCCEILRDLFTFWMWHPQKRSNSVRRPSKTESPV